MMFLHLTIVRLSPFTVAEIEKTGWPSPLSHPPIPRKAVEYLVARMVVSPSTSFTRKTT